MEKFYLSELSELLRVFDDIFLTHQEVYTATSCLIDKEKPNHDASQCEEVWKCPL